MYALIFDVDGVIADTERVNFEVTRDVLESLFQIDNIVRDDFKDGVGKGATGYVQAAAARHGKTLTPDETRQATDLRQQRFIERLADPDSPLPPFPGVIELMEQAIEDPRFCVGIATSSTREKAGAVLQSTGVSNYNFPWVTGDQVRNKKPDPELFLVAAKQLAVAPPNCIVFEDAPNGVRAAKSAGMKCVAVTNTISAEELSDADMVVESLEEVSLDTLLESLL